MHLHVILVAALAMKINPDKILKDTNIHLQNIRHHSSQRWLREQKRGLDSIDAKRIQEWCGMKEKLVVIKKKGKSKNPCQHIAKMNKIQPQINPGLIYIPGVREDIYLLGCLFEEVWIVQKCPPAML